MTVVLVHGNPETDAVWDPLVEALGRDDVVRLSPPGFGAPLPDGWPATFLAYRDWLEDELAHLSEPVDLVGHDWGGNHVVNVMMHRPELVRSWVTDIIGVFDPDYVWHDAALVWQTPDEGERLADAMLGGTLQERTDRMVGLGIAPGVAAKIATAQGPDMARALLALYRSARHPALADAGRSLELAAARPGLCLLATNDHYVGSEQIRRRTAARAGARTEVLEGLGHWWMVQDPARGAAALTGFWESLGDTDPMADRNVLGGPLEPCGTDPLTGFYRDGCCSTGDEDHGRHTVCAVVTSEFLDHQRTIGNDLSTPMPQYRFPGLSPGDRWCVTAVNWLRAQSDGYAAPVVLAATHERTLEVVPLATLREHAIDVPDDLSSL